MIDSGVDFTHPDLTNNQWTNPNPGDNGDQHGWDFIADGGEIKDEQGHGTAVAGIIAAEGNNSFGVTGVMWRASLMSLRVLDNTGTGDVAGAIQAIDYAVSHGAQVINLSWGTNGESFALRDAIERAIRRNVVVVCSAGNNSRDLDVTPYYPASFKLRNLISVAASDNSDRLPVWSNWGARSITLAAPGTNILTTQTGGGYWNVTGTSAAAPIVAGIAGLLKTVRPQGPVPSIVRAISDSVRPTASLTLKVSTGGVANAAGALAALRGSTNQSLPFQAPGIGSGGTGPGGSFSTTPPPATTGAPGANLPNLDVVRGMRPQQPQAEAPIESNSPCADCDPQGGGGGGGLFTINDPNFSTARRQPINETGESGVDLGSRNFNWSLLLLSLPGRAGLDLDLTLFYNSLVWTKDGSYIKFNADLGSPAPGFRLGLPKLQQRFLNSQTNIWAYMMVTPAGARVELRQVGTTNIYESQDSSYTRLDISDVNVPVIRTTDGTQYTFTSAGINNEYRCTQIKDRNGNYTFDAEGNWCIWGGADPIGTERGRILDLIEMSNPGMLPTIGPGPTRGPGGQEGAPETPVTPQNPTNPQNPAGTTPQQDDCHRFAALVQGIADHTHSDREFLDELARTFTSANDSRTSEMLRNSGGPVNPPRISLGDSGFKPQFQDGGNQVRHFVAGFIAGANQGLIGLAIMNGREDEENADTRLNRVSTDMGARYSYNPASVEFRRARLASQIREDVCQ